MQRIGFIVSRGTSGMGFAAVSVGLYERSSPPLAELLRGTEAGRALVRSAISPVVGIVDAAERASRILAK